MGGSKHENLNQMISTVMKTTNNPEQRVRRFLTSREEAINRCLNSLIHTLNCREGDSCRAHGCLKMKKVVEHTKICPKRTNASRCPICTQLMSLCFYHSKTCRASICHVPFCRIMKKKLQTLNENYAQKQSIQSLKPVFQFPIPPLNGGNLPTLYQHSQSLASSSTNHVNDRRERDNNTEPIPKRIRLDESESDSSSAINDHHNNEAQNSNVIDNVFNQFNNAQEPQTVEVA